LKQIIEGKIIPEVNLEELEENSDIKYFLNFFKIKHSANVIEDYKKLYHLLILEIEKIRETKSPDELKKYKIVKSKIKNVLFRKRPSSIILAIIIKSTKESFIKTQEFKYLSRLGIYVNSWLIYYKEHLYNCEGIETFEPIFNRDYLLNILKCMWNLSTQVFGKSNFSFDDLASAALESDIEKIKIAVNRINILSRNLARERKLTAAISFNDKGWRWENISINEHCNFVHYNKIYKIINDELGLPFII
jgi:hypothetical protein